MEINREQLSSPLKKKKTTATKLNPLSFLKIIHSNIQVWESGEKRG